MKVGDRVLVEEDHGNISWFARVVDNDPGGAMVEVLLESGPMEGSYRWVEAWTISPV